MIYTITCRKHFYVAAGQGRAYFLYVYDDYIVFCTAKKIKILKAMNYVQYN